MLIVITVLLISAAIAAVEAPKLWTSSSKRAAAVYLAFMALSNGTVALYVFGHLPNPADWIKNGLAPITDLLLRIGLLTP